MKRPTALPSTSDVELSSAVRPSTSPAVPDSPSASRTQKERAEDGARPNSGAAAGAGAEEFPISSFPDLPPRTSARSEEAFGGVGLVLCLISVLVTPTHLVAAYRIPVPARALVLAAIYTWAAVALCCLFHLMVGDPGEVKRSAAVCYPVPAEVADRLRRSVPLTDMANVRTQDGRRSYCVRCLVWRENSDTPHHCATCQRCVLGFDHHCGVFGRCIARGNILAFWLIILMGLAGFTTCVGACVGPVAGSQEGRASRQPRGWRARHLARLRNRAAAVAPPPGQARGVAAARAAGQHPPDGVHPPDSQP